MAVYVISAYRCHIPELIVSEDLKSQGLNIITANKRYKCEIEHTDDKNPLTQKYFEDNIKYEAKRVKVHNYSPHQIISTEKDLRIWGDVQKKKITNSMHDKRDFCPASGMYAYDKKGHLSKKSLENIVPEVLEASKLSIKPKPKSSTEIIFED